MDNPSTIAPQFKLKQRKREAVTKYDPEVFRTSFLDIIPKDPHDFDKYILTLELNDQKLDYKRYAEPLFELLIVGGMIAPGGVISNGSQNNPYSLFAQPYSKEGTKQQVKIINHLVRRYKYLQPKLFDTASHILQYITKFSDSWEKLAGFTAFLILDQLVPITILNKLTKEHLVKDGASLQFVTHVFKVYLEEQSMEHLGALLEKWSMDSKLLEFFPSNKRDQEYLARQFETEGLKPLVYYYKKRQQMSLKDKVKNELRTLLNEENYTKAASYLKLQAATNDWPNQEVTEIIWAALAMSIEWSSKPEQIESQLTTMISNTAALFREFTNTPKTEISFLQKVQLTCYEDIRLMKLFYPILRTLCDNEIVSDAAVIYWYDKGSLPQGRAVFLRQLEKYVTQLKEIEFDESGEESE